MKAGCLLFVVAATTLAGCNETYPEVDWSRLHEVPQDPYFQQLEDYARATPQHSCPGEPNCSPTFQPRCLLVTHRDGPHWNSTLDPPRPVRVGDVEHVTAVFDTQFAGAGTTGGSLLVGDAYRIIKRDPAYDYAQWTSGTIVTYDHNDTSSAHQAGRFLIDLYLQAVTTDPPANAFFALHYLAGEASQRCHFLSLIVEADLARSEGPAHDV